MKEKIFLASFILLAALVMISFFFTNETVQKPLFSTANPQQKSAQEDSPMRDYSYLLPPTSNSNPAITVIKKIAPPRKTTPIPTAEETQSQAEENFLQSPQSINTPSGTDESTAAPHNKYLTEIQKQDMRSRNTVLF